MTNLTVKLRGGFGNQLFQFAAGNYFSQLLNKDLDFNSEYLNFDVPDIVKFGFIAPKLLKKNYFLDNLYLTPANFRHKSFLYEKKLEAIRIRLGETISDPQNLDYFEMKNLKHKIFSPKTLRGWFQTDLFVTQGFLEYLRKIVYTKNLETFANSPSLINHDEFTIAIHIRNYNNDIFGTLNPEYYLSSILNIKSQNEIESIVIFSDNLKVAKTFQNLINNKFKFKVLLAPNNLSDFETFCYLSTFKNYVLANSSFSWWACKLADSPDKVVAPFPWFKKQNYAESICSENWIKTRVKFI